MLSNSSYTGILSILAAEPAGGKKINNGCEGDEEGGGNGNNNMNVGQLTQSNCQI